MSAKRSYGTLEPKPLSRSSERIHVDDQDGQVGRRRSWKTIAVICACVLLVSIAIYVIIPIWVWMGYTCGGFLNPPVTGPKDWAGFKNQSFAVGFDLTAGYGTAAVLFPNGTLVDVARAEGSSKYNEVLARLSLESSAHPTPPYYNCTAQVEDRGRQWRSHFLKLRGRPTSSDIAALAEILSNLTSQTNTFLGEQGPLEMAFITIPPLPALYLEDLVDAAEYAGIQLFTLPGSIHRSGDQGQWPVSEINTAFAGNDFWLNSLSSATTKDQPSLSDVVETPDNGTTPAKPRSINVFSVLFTNNALTAHVSPINSAPTFYAASGITNFSLGLSSCASSSSPPTCPPTSPYWAQIRLALRTALASYYRSHELGRVISHGESAHNDIFDALLREEVLAVQTGEGRPEFASKDPVFAAARGAALFAQYCTTLPSFLSCFPDLMPRLQGW